MAQKRVNDDLVVADDTQVTIVEGIKSETLLIKAQRHINQIRIRTEKSAHQLKLHGKYLRDVTYWWYNVELDRWVGLKNNVTVPYTERGRWTLVCLSYNGKVMLGVGGE